jgi:S-adenosylmethionine:tRNA ribosyltransferase-isomerase
MHLSEFDYPLPSELIAQRQLAERDASRMMVLDRASETIEHCRFRELPELLEPGDLLVFNNTKVIPARLLGRRRGTRAQPLGKHNPARREHLTGEVELLLVRREEDDTWLGLVRPGRKIPKGEVLVFGDDELEAEVVGRGQFGVRRLRLGARNGAVDAAIERLGHVPLPPYIRRSDDPSDRANYQTIFARVPGAVAAPTAGLHFTPRVLTELRARGVETCEVTLHVGLGTFQPVHVERIEDHKMDIEEFEISEAAAEAIRGARRERRRVVAVGTTVVRSLEHAARERAGEVVPCRGKTDLFITPGFRFQAVQALLTNFHLPKSTLLMLVSAFAGKDFLFRAYREAVVERYRFYSYGDCMLIL